MSHFAVMKSQIKDLQSLVDACKRLGLNIKVGKNLKCRGYGSQITEVTGAVVHLSNCDVGFNFKNGDCEVIKDDWMLTRKEGIDVPNDWVNKITQLHNVELCKRKAKMKGYEVFETEMPDGSIKLKVRV